MSDLSEIPQKPKKMNYQSPAFPVSEISQIRTPTSFSSATNAGDNRRYQFALAISVAVFVAVVAFGFYITAL